VELPLLCAADGVGGHKHGEVASAIAVHMIPAYLSSKLVSLSSADLNPDAIVDALGASFKATNTAILAAAEGDKRLSGMATTAVCAVIVDGALYVAWAGDSRCYRFHEGQLTRVTTDHSEVQRLIDAGIVAPEVANEHQLAHIINRHLGQAGTFEAETRIAPLTPGDVVLLCTDGLTDVVSDSSIAESIAEHLHDSSTFEELPGQLANRALKAGTQDNVTVLCFAHHPDGSERLDLRMTLSGSYGIELAEVLRHLSKETDHE
jgi:protein phosphatase